jgi:hypothetical protein
MLAGGVNGPVYHVYRLRLEASLHIPADADEQRVHEIIATGFEPTRIKAWSEQSLFSTDALNQDISMSTLHRRLGADSA